MRLIYIITKTEIIKNLLNNDISDNKSCKMLEGHGNLMLITKQAIASLPAVQATQKTR